MKDTAAITILVDKSIRQQLKIIAARREESMRDLLVPAIEKLIHEHATHTGDPQNNAAPSPPALCGR